MNMVIEVHINQVLNQTEKGIQLRVFEKEFWLPKSQLIMTITENDSIRILIPDWLVEKHQLGKFEGGGNTS